MKKKDIIFLTATMLIFLMLYGAFWLKFNITLAKSQNDWYEKEYVDKEINGVLKSITEFDSNPFMIVLSIKNLGDKFDLTYGTICVDKEFRDFVAIGDSIKKKEGNESVKFCKSKGEFKEL